MIHVRVLVKNYFYILCKYLYKYDVKIAKSKIIDMYSLYKVH